MNIPTQTSEYDKLFVLTGVRALTASEHERFKYLTSKMQQAYRKVWKAVGENEHTTKIASTLRQRSGELYASDNDEGARIVRGIAEELESHARNNAPQFTHNGWDCEEDEEDIPF